MSEASGSAFAMSAVIPRGAFPHHQGQPENVCPRDRPVEDDGMLVLPDCGTRLDHMPGGAAYANRNIKPGTLDDRSWLIPTIHFWTRSAQEWVVIPEAATRYDTQPEILSWHTPKS